MEDDVVCFELVAVVLCTLEDGVTVTVTVDFWPLLQSEALWDARGAAAASPNREEMKILECILSKEFQLKEGVVNDSVSEDSDYRNQKSRE